MAEMTDKTFVFRKIWPKRGLFVDLGGGKIWSLHKGCFESEADFFPVHLRKTN